MRYFSVSWGLGWRVLTEEDNLWVRIVKNKYLYIKSFSERKIKGINSWVWKKIIKLTSF